MNNQLAKGLLGTDVYGVTADSIPDAAAAFLWGELQSRSDELGRQGIEINSGLKPFHSKYYRESLFENYQPPGICSLADEFGIKPSDESGFGPLLARLTVLQTSFIEDEFELDVAYLDWLMKHDLNLEYAAGDFLTSILHDLGAVIGRRLAAGRHISPCVLSCEGFDLLAKLWNSEMQTNLPCPCVSGVFNRPLVSLFSGFSASAYRGGPWELKTATNVCLLVALIEDNVTVVYISYLARCAVHGITIEILGIRHVGACPRNILYRRSWDKKEGDQDERAELLDEDRLLLEKLDDLDEKFAREFRSRNETVVDFLRGHYTEQMEEVVKEIDVPPEDDYKHELVAAGVVLAEPR
ncbi:hypothetical protein FPCIR_1861 [Fusarium pseudocircinatum]|uniref:Uncharacterized protein n=1 Tax=Fusarium pseudocircinatum TaxID=56676 RepID=A0A8H5PSX5_9HYPO|nr:hypothetical protein FPCIR_1861 [Fusarium pseudocircinatum]